MISAKKRIVPHTFETPRQLAHEYYFITHFSILVFLCSAFLNCSDQKAIDVPTYEILRIAPQILENSHISVARPSTAGDGLLPAGWHLLADWHWRTVRGGDSFFSPNPRG